MGVGTRDSSIFLSIADGKVVQSFKTEQAGTTPRTNKRGVTVFERHFDFIEGVLAKIETRTHDFGKDYVLTVVDGNDTYKVSISYNSRYATSLLKALPNIDLAAPVKIQPYKMADRNDRAKSVTGIVVYQNGNKVPMYYTKEDPKGLPQMQQVKFKGQLVWDSSDMDQFLEKMALGLFTGATVAKPVAPAPAKPTAGGEEIPAESDDDCPF